MGERQQKFEVSVPLSIPLENLNDLGDVLIDFIQNRTKDGLDVNNRPFKKYSDAYAESLDFKIAGKVQSTVNLEQSGDMMADIEILDTSPGSIIIGYEKGSTSNDHAAWQQENTQAKFPKRQFLGISSVTLEALISDFIVETPEITKGRETVKKEASSIIRKLFFRQ